MLASLAAAWPHIPRSPCAWPRPFRGPERGRGSCRGRSCRSQAGQRPHMAEVRGMRREQGRGCAIGMGAHLCFVLWLFQDMPLMQHHLQGGDRNAPEGLTGGCDWKAWH